MLLPLNRLLASTPFNRKLLLVSRSPLAHTGALPRPEFTPDPPGSSAFTPGERIATPVKLPGGQWDVFNLGPVEYVPVGGIHRVHQRVHIDLNRIGHRAHFQLCLQRNRAIGLHQNFGHFPQ